MTTPGPTIGYAPVNGLQLYYAIYGAVRPLVLLHGGLGVTGMFPQLLPIIPPFLDAPPPDAGPQAG